MRPSVRIASAGAAFALTGLVSCAKPSAPAQAPPPRASAAPTTSTPPATTNAAATPSPSPSPVSSADPPATPGAGRACGELGCRAFDRVLDAFEYALRGAPRVVAIGESHAQKDAPRVPSATARFRETLLPALAGRTKGLVVELLLPDKRCRKQEVNEVEKRQEAVTKPQAETNQNEYVLLGQAAKSLGVVPQPLVPSCDELKAVLAAGAGDIDAMLQLIAAITVRETLALLERGDPAKSVITYGGLVHNDLAPRPGREAWSFGPRLRERTGGSYVEIDLIVPEFVRAEAPWTALPWYTAFAADRESSQARLFEPTPGSFVLVFPRTPQQNPGS